MRKPQRKWISIIGGGLFGFGMSKVPILIITGVFVQSQGAFVFTIVGLFIISTFLGSIFAGVIDKGDAGMRGIQAVLITLVIYLMFDFVVLLFVGFRHSTLAIDMYIIYMASIPTVFLGGIGGKIGGSLRLKYRKLK